MTIDGAYHLIMTIPSPAHDGTFFDGVVDLVLKGQPDGTLTGTVSAPGGPPDKPAPITKGYYTGSEFIKIMFNVGPGAWEIWARVLENGDVTGMVSIGNGGGMPNKVTGKKLG